MLEQDIVIAVIVCIGFVVFGSCVGSFLNVAVYRLPNGKSLVHPSSHCPKCGHPVRWFDNVPVFGWILLGGKCRDCRLPISVRYPLIEVFCGLLSGGIFWCFWSFCPKQPISIPITAAVIVDILATVFVVIWFADPKKRR